MHRVVFGFQFPFFALSFGIWFNFNHKKLELTHNKYGLH